ncbi:tRNA pseudouridine synthase 3 [Bulinus truncatus]|nr:tRNA pseudouridine synthase 3 [Bulinus truncatus]
MATPGNFDRVPAAKQFTPDHYEHMSREEVVQNDVKQESLHTEEAPSASGNGTTLQSNKKIKGIKVNCGELRKYLYGVEIYRQASMLRKGREVHKIYVDVHKGVSFLDDRFTLTEFGRMVLENGSVRAGRARNVRQIVVARETLYCSGTGGCKRACGGYGHCVSGCDKIKVRGHKCSFRVKLTMRLGFVDHWFVEILGSHNCYIDDDPPNDMEKMLAAYDTKITEGDYGDLSLSQRASPLADTESMLSVTHTGAGFFSSPSTPVLLTPAHCPLNVPLFPESYMMTIARNAAAAVAMTNGNGLARGQPSPLSLSLKQDRLPSDIVAPEIMNGLLPPSAIPRLGAIPMISSSSPSPGDNGHSPNTPISGVMDLSTPRIKEESIPRDLSVGTGLFKSWSNHPTAGLNATSMATASLNGTKHEASQAAYLNDIKKSKRSYSHIPESQETSSSSGSPKCSFNSAPSIPPRLPSTSMLFSLHSQSTSSMAGQYLKSIYRNLKPNNIPFNSQSSRRISPVLASTESSTPDKSPPIEEIEIAEVLEGELDKDLINRVQQLEAHVTQLRNIVLKQDGTKEDANSRRKQQRVFDFTKYNTRHVALKIAYLGWDYNGFVVQEDTEKTVEAAVFEALLKTRLIESRECANYHRCGRTDKGVSALGQVISLDLRTNLLSGVGVKVREGGSAHTRTGDVNTEIRYVYILNKVLPPEIRVLAWAPVDPDFSARFSCKKRTYKYYFPKGNLDLDLMNLAASKLVGEHDFRNLCKMDVGNGVVNFTRKIFRADVSSLKESNLGYSMCELTVVGQAFLWHQIRCIVSVLFLIGQGKEDLMVLDELLDVNKNPRKPQYAMASELPLVLFDCDFGDNLEWIYEADWHEDNIRHLQQLWAQHTIKATMIKKMLEELDVAKVETDSDIAPWNELSTPVLQQTEWMIPGNKPKTYKPLMKRQTCESLEERVEYYAKRRKLQDKESIDVEATELP